MIRIGRHLIDAAISEEESLESEVTEYPVESGAVITDHVRNKPRRLDLEFVVSDTPIGLAAIIRDADVVPSSDARQKLEALRATRQPFPVVTGIRTYENMIFTSLSFPRDGGTGDALRGKASLQQIEIVQVRRVSVQLKPHLGNRVARGVDGKDQWLCPIGVDVVKSPSENLRHGCRKVVARTFGDQTNLVFADTGAALNDTQIGALGTQKINSETGSRLPEVAVWNPVGQEWVVPAAGQPPTRIPTQASTFRLMTGVDADYKPPEPVLRDGRLPGAGPDYVRNPFDR